MAKRSKRPPLSLRRRLRAERGGPTEFRGKPLNYNAGAETRYAAALLREIASMRLEAQARIRALYRANAPAVTSGLDASMASQARILLNEMARRFEVLFQRLAPVMAKQFMAGIEAASATNLASSLRQASGGLNLRTTVISGRVKEIVTASTAENVALIKSVPRKYFDTIQQTVLRSITTGQGEGDVLRLIESTGEVTRKRAKLIARDQTSKITSAINAARMKDLGIDEFEWLHSGGGKEPRELHVKMSGNIYSLNDPPVIDEDTGETGLPGQLINCRCRMVPVINFKGPTP